MVQEQCPGTMGEREMPDRLSARIDGLRGVFSTERYFAYETG